MSHCGQVVFLDEIGDMDERCQTRLLTYMDDSRILPKGCTQSYSSPCILIAATNKDIDDPSWGFRQDIIHRFDHIIRIPPMRERKEDLRLLCSLTLQKERINPRRPDGARAKEDTSPRRKVNFISMDAIEYLEGLRFPGNFRELESTLARAVNNAFAERSDCIYLKHVVQNK